MTDKSQGQIPTDKKAFEANRAASGTREWSDASHNIALGCDHNCLYCYACAMFVMGNKLGHLA